MIPNDVVLDALQMRVSSPRLASPGPTPPEVDRMLRCAVRAPDHGLLRPWRFVLFREADRERLGELFVAAERRRNPAASDEALAKLRGNPLRAPLVIACVAIITPGHKVPIVEQIACVAAAVENLQLAAEALGYGAMWRTGTMAGDPTVKTGLGFAEKDEILAWLYIGTVDGARRVPEMLDPSPFVQAWNPETTDTQS